MKMKKQQFYSKFPSRCLSSLSFLDSEPFCWGNSFRLLVSIISFFWSQPKLMTTGEGWEVRSVFGLSSLFTYNCRLISWSHTFLVTKPWNIQTPLLRAATYSRPRICSSQFSGRVLWPHNRRHWLVPNASQTLPKRCRSQVYASPIYPHWDSVHENHKKNRRQSHTPADRNTPADYCQGIIMSIKDLSQRWSSFTLIISVFCFYVVYF